jgi:tetratricopeptide (TPR) repeat protein
MTLAQGGNTVNWIARTCGIATSLCLLIVASCTTPPAAPPTATASTPPTSEPPATVAQWAKGAQLFDGLGNYHRKAGTRSDEAQAYFDQAMRFLWAFNHDEATRSFAKAAEIDPQCAICYWGVSLTVGPNYNLPMMAEPRAKVAWEALQQAEANASRATPVERALIHALASRYRDAQKLDPSNEGPVLIAYARAMQDVARRFPNDSDVQVLTAEAMMNTNAWKLWRLDGTPAPGTKEIVARLEAVLAKDRMHPGANHYYVHAIEASPHPEKAVAAAERLRGMMPAAGHLEHMPAHIMQRVGRYGEAAEANRLGAAADLAYFARTTPPDYYKMYTAHNYEFLAFSTAMQGRRADTLDAARKARGIVTERHAAGRTGCRLVPDGTLCSDGALRHVGRDSCGTGAERQAEGADRRISVRQGRRACCQGAHCRCEAVACRVAEGRDRGNRRWPELRRRCVCHRRPRGAGAHRRRGAEQRPGDRIAHTGGRKGRSSRL